MSVLNEFRTDVRKNALYRGRLDAERLEATRQEELERARAEREAALADKEAALAREKAAFAEKEAERAEKEAERAEKERMAARLRALGIDPDAK